MGLFVLRSRRAAMILLAAPCLWLVSFFVPFASGQSTGARFSPGTGMRQGGRCWKASNLRLSPDQLKGLNDINLTYARETRSLRSEIFSKRMELRELLTDSTIRIESIQLKKSEIVDLQSKLEEKAIEYLIKVRTLLNQDQLKNWCPEQEFPFFGAMMGRPDFNSPMSPRRIAPPERAIQE